MNVFSPSEENETVSETTYRPGHESLVLSTDCVVYMAQLFRSDFYHLPSY